MIAHAEAGYLHDGVLAVRQSFHLGTPQPEVGSSALTRIPGVINANCNVRIAFRQCRERGHVLDERIVAEDQSVIRQPGEALLPCLVRQIAVIPQVADAAQVREPGMPGQRLGAVRRGQVRIGDDPVRHSAPVGRFLQPLRLGHRIRRSNRRLHVHHVPDITEASFGQEVLRNVAPSLDRVIVSELGIDGICR